MPGDWGYKRYRGGEGMKEFDNLINNAKISEIQDYRYFEKFAKQLEFKDLSGKDIETIKQLKDCIETININNRVVGEKNLELEDTIKQLHEQIEAMLKADKITIVKYGPNCAEGFDDMVRIVKQLQNQIPLKKIEAIKQLRKRIAAKLLKLRLQLNNYQNMRDELVERLNMALDCGEKTHKQLIEKIEINKQLTEKVEGSIQTIKRLTEEKETINKQLINEQLTDEQLIIRQTIKIKEQEEQLKYHQEKEERREKEHQACIDKILEMEKEIEGFRKGSLAVKLNEVTKERNEAVFELSEEKQKKLTVINQMNKLREELKESEENSEQLVEFNRNYQEDIKRLEEKNSNLYSNYHEACRETEELQKRMIESNVKYLQREEKLVKKKLEIVKEVLDL